MKKRNVWIMVIFLLILVICLYSLSTQQLLLGCYWQDCVPERNFHVLDWEIPSNFFPIDAKVSHMMVSSEGMGETERGSQNIFWKNGDGIAIYEIYRYPTLKKAMLQYKSVAGQMVDDGTKKPWLRPKELTFSTSTADEIFIGCGNWMGQRCGMIARYQEYVIFFNSVVDDQMTFNQFEKIVSYLDKQISSRLFP